jgi:hydrophobic W protein
MTNGMEKYLGDVEKRVSRLENLVWVLGAVALFLGIGGGSLWAKLDAATARANEIAKTVENSSERIDKDVAVRMRSAITELDAKSADIRSEIEKLRGADPGWGVAYCTHQESNSWHPWVSDGEQSGRSGISKRLEAIKIVLYRKNGAPPSGPCT